MAGIRYTAEERQSMAKGKALAKALMGIETFDGDPEMILNDAEISIPAGHAAKKTLAALRHHFTTESPANE